MDSKFGNLLLCEKQKENVCDLLLFLPLLTNVREEEEDIYNIYFNNAN
jgi:hypothetical protein